MSDLRGRSAIVTGGAHGIGAAIARTLVKSGLGVVVADILEHEGEVTAAALENAVFRRLDVTDDDQLRLVLDEAEANFGPLAVLVNNAGILDSGTVESEWVAMFRHVVDVNLMSQLELLRCFIVDD